jgi:transposase-like protein
LQQISELLEKATDGYSVPTQMLIYRNDNEVDFKMSCPYCGQKLWVRDADQDKRGRCPHCGKGFTLPAEEENTLRHLDAENHSKNATMKVKVEE